MFVIYIQKRNVELSSDSSSIRISETACLIAIKYSLWDLQLKFSNKFLVFMFSPNTTNKFQETPVEIYRLSLAGFRKCRLKYGYIFSDQQLLCETQFSLLILDTSQSA